MATTVNNTGGYAQLALAQAANVYAVPTGLPLDRAVAVFQAGAVAVGVLAAMHVRPGDTVLITAAAGRIGSLLVQLAKAARVTVIGAAGGAGETRRRLPVRGRRHRRLQPARLGGSGVVRNRRPRR